MSSKPVGIVVPLPTECKLCGQYVGQCWDVHMVLTHPETRPKPERPLVDEKKKKK